jgi:hypothetical protein
LSPVLGGFDAMTAQEVQRSRIDMTSAPRAGERLAPPVFFIPPLEGEGWSLWWRGDDARHFAVCFGGKIIVGCASSNSSQA